MAKGRKAAKVESFGELYGRMVHGRQFVSELLAGHLAIEFLLRRLLVQYDAGLERHADGLKFEPLARLAHDVEIIGLDQRDVLLSINALRNKLAHQLTYEPTIADLKALLLAARGAFSDFTDGIAQGLDAIEGVSATLTLDELHDWPLAELFVQISYDLHHLYTEAGGDEETF